MYNKFHEIDAFWQCKRKYRRRGSPRNHHRRRDLRCISRTTSSGSNPWYPLGSLPRRYTPARPSVTDLYPTAHPMGIDTSWSTNRRNRRRPRLSAPAVAARPHPVWRARQSMGLSDSFGSVCTSLCSEFEQRGSRRVRGPV